LIAVAAACLYLLVSLLSYSDADPGWSATGNGGAVRNLGGPTGAWLSDVCFSLVGYLAYLFPLMLGYRAALLFTERDAQVPFSWSVVAVRASGLVLVMLAGTALAAMNYGAGGSLPQGAGGVIGHAVGSAVSAAFSAVGGRLILVAVFLFGMTIFTDLSWLRLMDRLGSLAIGTVAAVRRRAVELIDGLRDRRQREKQLEARRQVIDRHVAREKKRKPPKIKPMQPPSAPSERVEREKQVPLFDAPVTGELPPLELLDAAQHDPDRGFSPEALEKLSKLLELKLLDFGVTAEVTAVYPGPVITRFEIQPRRA
jgi:S-DNA-T family DNA segregation ATPase FtsK/SpoIIIE